MRVAIALGVAGFLGLAVPALAVEARECDWAASAAVIAEPWEANTRALYNGQVRVALMDTGGEPVCCSMQLLILAPDRQDELGGRMCRLIGSTEALGFAGIDFARLTTRYDAGRGLLITFPYQLYVDGIRSRSGVARVRVNVERATIGVE